jgi:hypothetical protein
MDYLMTELHAKEGYVYTNGVLFSKDVYLSELDSEDNWKEITEEEARESKNIEEGTRTTYEKFEN